MAVPIVIHLLFRQRARRVEIGTIHFLRVVLQDQARRRRIRRWLLLALRTAGVLLLALLFARPFWRAPETLGSEREAVVLIDRSASMAAGTAGATPFDKAQRQATELIAGLPSGTTVGLAYFDADGVAPAEESKIDPAMRPALAGTDYTKALGWARHYCCVAAAQAAGVSFDRPSALRNRTAAGGCLSGRHRNRGCRCWPSADDEPGRRRRAGRTDGAQGRQAAHRRGPRLQRGVFPARDVRVSLSLNGKPPIEKTLSIDGHSRQLVRFEAPVNEPGLYHGFVEVAASDDLLFDNRRWLAFQARRPDRVLLIDGQPGPSVFGNETYYLETALRLRLPGDPAAASPSPFEPTRAAMGRPGQLAGRSEPVSRRHPVQCARRVHCRREHARALRRIGRKLDHLHGRPGRSRCLRRAGTGEGRARTGARSLGHRVLPVRRLVQRPPDLEPVQRAAIR